jgi:hypothetical protein|tara:strand:+ start:540 stop:887 length:348 start_codon:yes stop_codon:yes gene_type:complete
MATNANWTVIFDDKLIIKQTGDDAGTGYIINNDVFWSESKFLNIWAIQYQTSVTTDEVEYRDQTPNGTYADANLGDFQQFIDLWDTANLTRLQNDWDNDPRDESEKGSRPTSYSS